MAPFDPELVFYNNKLTIQTVWLITLSEHVESLLWGLGVVSPCQTALFIYDTLLTFSLKVKYIWRKKLKLGSVLYIFARYPVVLNLLTPFPPFQTIKVSSYIPRNVQS